MAVSRLRLLLSLNREGILGMSSSPLCNTRNFCSSSDPYAIERVGFIGLGNMGSRMVQNLVKGGYSVVVHDINHGVMKAFSEKGILTKNSPLEVAEESDALITMLPSSAHVLDVYTGPKGILNHGDQMRSWLFIDSSTIDPQTSRKLSAAITKFDIKGKRGGSDTLAMLDAPVSGGSYQLRMELLLSWLVVLRKLISLQDLCFFQWAKTSYTVVVQEMVAAKICNNLAMAVSMLGVSEAISLGQSLGIGATTLTEIFNASSARCWSSDTYNPVPGVMNGVPASRNYDGGFATTLMAKDLNLAAASAKEVGATSPMTTLSQRIFAELCDRG